MAIECAKRHENKRIARFEVGRRRAAGTRRVTWYLLWKTSAISLLLQYNAILVYIAPSAIPLLIQMRQLQFIRAFLSRRPRLVSPVSCLNSENSKKSCRQCLARKVNNLSYMWKTMMTNGSNDNRDETVSPSCFPSSFCPQRNYTSKWRWRMSSPNQPTGERCTTAYSCDRLPHQFHPG